ncbi:MAG: hypothetical protein LIP05_08235 [Tannerellaceae bacterium]|nr:hypothetical protein [Tannerellaceae bacterium]
MNQLFIYGIAALSGHWWGEIDMFYKMHVITTEEKDILKDQLKELLSRLEDFLKGVEMSEMYTNRDVRFYVSNLSLGFKEILLKHAKKLSDIRSKNLDQLLPKVTPNCMYRNPSSFAIDPSGDMFKCLEYLGNSQYKVGNIREKKAFFV